MKKKLLFFLLLILALGLGVFAYFDMERNILDVVNKQQNVLVDRVNKQQQSTEVLLRSRVLAGLSMGMLFLLGGAYLLPIFLRNVDTGPYHKELGNGILASAVFLGMTAILDRLQPQNYVAYGLAIIAVVVITLKILSFILGGARKTILTVVAGSIVSGLMFSALVHFVTVGIDYSTKELRKVIPAKLNLPGSK